VIRETRRELEFRSGEHGLCVFPPDHDFGPLRRGRKTAAVTAATTAASATASATTATAADSVALGI
jgi:hypothetical protein